jgi:MSHA pilin protein MshC
MPVIAKGFTLVELIGIIAIAGILAMVAVPRFFGTTPFASRGYADSAAAFLRYARNLAIARHGGVSVVIDGDGMTLCRKSGASCAAADWIPGPDGSAPYRVVLPDGVSHSGNVTSIRFDAQGRPDNALDLTITGDPVRSLKVAAETGYVHD